MKSIISCIEISGPNLSGSSHPVAALGSDGLRYFVKLKGGMSSPYAMLNEWVCLKIANKLHLPVQEPMVIQIEEETNCSRLYVENRELIKKSVGLNIAFPYAENAEQIDVHSVNEEVAKQLFLFDLFTLNMDRTEINSNIIAIDKMITIIDFESTLLVPGIVQRISSLSHQSVKAQMRNHVFFSGDISRDEFQKMFSELQNLEFNSTVNDIPEDWLQAKINKMDLCGGLMRAAMNTAGYWKLYCELKELSKELPEKRLQRILANRTAFERTIAAN